MVKMLKSLPSVKQVDDCSNRLQIYIRDEFGFKGARETQLCGRWMYFYTRFLFYSIHSQPSRRDRDWADQFLAQSKSYSWCRSFGLTLNMNMGAKSGRLESMIKSTMSQDANGHIVDWIMWSASTRRRQNRFNLSKGLMSNQYPITSSTLYDTAMGCMFLCSGRMNPVWFDSISIRSKLITTLLFQSATVTCWTRNRLLIRVFDWMSRANREIEIVEEER